MNELTRWMVACDAPGCDASVEACGDSDREAIDSALRAATAHGWYIAHDRFIRPHEDLCPEHRRGKR